MIRDGQIGLGTLSSPTRGTRKKKKKRPSSPLWRQSVKKPFPKGICIRLFSHFICQNWVTFHLKSIIGKGIEPMIIGLIISIIYANHMGKTSPEKSSVNIKEGRNGCCLETQQNPIQNSNNSTHTWTCGDHSIVYKLIKSLGRTIKLM